MNIVFQHTPSGVRPHRARLVLGTAVVAGLAGVLLAPSNQAAADSAAPVIATGAIPSRYGLDHVEVELLPAITRTMHAGQSLPTYAVPHSALQLTPDHELVVRLAGTAVPRSFRSSQGVVDLSVHAWSTDSSWSTTLSAQALRLDASATTWADPQDVRDAVARSRAASLVRFSHGTAAITSALPSRPAGRAAARLTDALAHLAPPTFADGGNGRAGRTVSPRVVSPNCPDGGQGPHQSKLLSTRVAWATVGTSYPVGKDTAWMTVTSSSSNGASYGGALAYSGVGPTASGEAFASGDWSFTWAASGRARSYRKQIEYTRLREYNYLAGPGCDHVRWVPYRETGGTAYNTDQVYRPHWTDCRRVSAGTWARSIAQGNKYEYGEAVKLKDALGIDLSISRSYSHSQSISYAVTGRDKRMCGNNDEPAYAGKVMEKFR